MARTVLADTGAIVAALRSRDKHHAWARQQWSGLTEPCLTCEAVVSECFFLLEGAKEGKEKLSQLLERGVIRVAFDFADSKQETLSLLRRYHDTPMSFADACLVRMSEMFAESQVFTTDSDFVVCRRFGRQVIPLIVPW
ncbi:MAG: PIN domain-containing protein [Verrucomicrobiaceae bacterium]|nr:PIN domain-containing protein [Verrucomicrobiaceae bacterium]